MEQYGQIIKINRTLKIIQKLDYESIRFWEDSRNWNNPEWNAEIVTVDEEVMEFWTGSKSQRLDWNV